jgi:predicted DNA-binding protein YlxM (UPF0122 family)
MAGHTSYEMAEARLSRKYALHTKKGVESLLMDIHHLRSSRFYGSDTSYISNLLVDFELLLGRSKLTKKQSEALFIKFERDMTQQETASLMGITQQAVSKHIDNAVRKIVIKAKEERKQYV